ncbi:MAG: hypothetical protein WCY11_04480 [Novosphingobium sp.]
MTALMASTLAIALAWFPDHGAALAAGEQADASIAPVAMPATGTRELEISWPDMVHLTVEPSPYEVIVRFDRPLDEQEIARFSREAGPLLADLRWNDDSLVLRAAPGNHIEVEPATTALRVRFVAESQDAEGTPTDPASAVTEATDLELARAQADAAAGFPGLARHRLVRLAAVDPANPQVQRALADTEAAEGALPYAARRYLEQGARDRAARRVIAEADGRASGTFILRDGTGFSQWETGVEAAAQVNFGLVLGVGQRQVTTTARAVSGPGGYVARIRRTRAVASLSASLFSGPELRLTGQVTSLLDKSLTGAALRLFAGPPERQARLLASYRLPDFSTAEQSWLGGHVTRLGAGGTLRITPELVAQADAGWNGYGLAGSGVRTTSVVASGGLDYLLLRGKRTLQITYRLDAEYVRRMDLRANGIPFIPLSDRENHTVQGIFSMPLKRIQATAAAGWTWDRYGGNGPTASVGVVANPGDAWRIEASGGVSSISRAAISGRQLYLQVTVTRFFRR